MLMNKTAIECRNILKYEIESIIDKFVPFQKQGKRCKKKHLSNEAIRKIVLKKLCGGFIGVPERKKTMQITKRHEQKLACNIKHDSKSLYAYVRSNQNLQDKVGPLEDSAGNIISQGFLMAEDLNGYFSLPKKILVHYQLLMLNFRRLHLTI